MGWGFYVDDKGRDAGYSVEATCDLDGCDRGIDRGVSFLCLGCADFFCGDHLFWVRRYLFPAAIGGGACAACMDRRDEEISGLVEEWHLGGGPEKLHAHLGMTESEFAEWVTEVMDDREQER